MGCLSILILTGCHMLGLCLQSADVPLVYGAVVSLFLLTFHKAQVCEVSKFMTALALVFFAGHVKPSKWVEYPHLLHLSFCLYVLLGSKDFLL